MLKLKRAYDPVSHTDGTRLLVERLWPRGLSKAKLHVDAWLKDVGPSTELRKWFSHDPERWARFRRRYFRELDSQPEAWRPIVSAARRGTVTLVYSSHDEQHNNAVALQDYLRAKMRRPAVSAHAVAADRVPASGQTGAARRINSTDRAANCAIPLGLRRTGAAPSWHDGRPSSRYIRRARLRRRV